MFCGHVHILIPSSRFLEYDPGTTIFLKYSAYRRERIYRQPWTSATVKADVNTARTDSA
jgi:hypothetical protein